MVIKIFINVLKTDLYRAIFSYGFLIGASGSLLMLLCGGIDMISSRSAVGAFEYSFAHNNAMLILIAADSFVYSASFSNEWNNGYFRPCILRTSPTIYALSKGVSTAIASGLSVMTGAALFMAGLCVKQPQIMPYYYESNLYFYGFLENVNHPFFFFWAYLIMFFLQGMFFSVLGLLITGYFTNKYVAYAAPVTLCYAINRFTTEIMNWPAWTDPMRILTGKLNYLPSVQHILIPIEVFGGMTIICTVWFVHVVKRRIANG